MDIECLSVIPGYGKSTKAIELINNKSEHDFFLVCVPLVSEIKRYLEKCPNANLVEPSNDGSTKRDSVKDILKETDHSIITTHKMYERIDGDIVTAIKKKCLFKGTKILIIDESLDVVSPSSVISNEDMTQFKELGLVSINEDTGLVSALKYFPSRYKNTQNVIESGLVYFYNNRYVVFEIGIDLLRAFDRVLILTHRFKTSIMYNYLKSEGLNVKFLPADVDKVNRLKEQARKRIIILDDIEIKGKLSKSAFDADPDGMKIELNRCIKEAMDVTGIPLEETRYTFFKRFSGMDEKATMRWLKSLKIGKGEQNEDGTPKAFLGHTTKASNAHAHCRLMVWGLDKHIHPGIVQCFSERGETINKREWSTSQLIQWLWRSNIRVTESEGDYGELIPNEKPVYVAILHKKTREEFKKWLNSDEAEQNPPMDSKRLRTMKQQHKRWVKQDPARQSFSFEDYQKHGGQKLKEMLIS